MYLTWNHQTKIATMTTKLDVPSGKNLKVHFKWFLRILASGSEKKMSVKILTPKNSLITANFHILLKQFTDKYFFSLS